MNRSLRSKLFESYMDNGYCISPNLIKSEDIDDFINKIETNLYANKEIEIPQMDTQQFGKISLSKFGYLKNPIADIHLLKYVNPNLTSTWESAIKILTNTDLIEIVNLLTVGSSQSLVMSMFFDQNAGTPLHQDCYYLDTLPPRKITAAWIALEDINEKAGRFCVAPKSQDFFLDLTDDEIKNSNKYEKRIANLITEKNIDLVAPILRKGDVLFWNSGTIHGSLKTQDESFSRKSFTCHFVPNYCDYVQNQYVPIIRPIEGFSYNKTICRITNSIKRDKIETNLISRTLDSFLR
jgi:phytanoyl-CoA hydroxylase